MRPRLPIILPLGSASSAYRWRLVNSTYGSAGVIVEGFILLVATLILCAMRTHVTAFLWLLAGAFVVVAVRLWDSQAFGRVRAASGNRMSGEPERWMLRHAAGAIASSMLWGSLDSCVLLLTSDTPLQFYVLMMQAGWITAACMRLAACPIAVMGQILCSLVPTAICLCIAPQTLITLTLPAAVLHIVASWRMSSSLGKLLVQNIQSEHSVELMNTRLAEANEKLTQLSLVDGLTGIANRRAFDETLEREWGRASRDASPLALLMLDVDFFKLYNDRYGHLAGDECLRRVAKLAALSVRRSADLTARYGGEEFAALLPATCEQGALEMAERLRMAIVDAAIPHAGAPSGHMSVSIGVASIVPGREADRQSLIHLADGALYAAKKNGRNQVRAAGALTAVTQIANLPTEVAA